MKVTSIRCDVCLQLWPDKSVDAKLIRNMAVRVTHGEGNHADLIWEGDICPKCYNLFMSRTEDTLGVQRERRPTDGATSTS